MDSIDKLCNIINDKNLIQQIRKEQANKPDYQANFDAIPTVNIEDIFFRIEWTSVELRRCLGHWGNMSIEALVKLCMITKYLQPTNIFEFGTFNGLSTLNMAVNSSANIYTLDLPSHITPLNNAIDSAVSKQVLEKFHNSIGSFFVDKNLRIIQLLGNSNTFNFEPFYNQMDLVFIDGGHDIITKVNDTFNALKMLRKGGTIIWDNVKDPVHPEVTEAIIKTQIKIKHIRNTFLGVYRDNII